MLVASGNVVHNLRERHAGMARARLARRRNHFNDYVKTSLSWKDRLQRHPRW